MLPCGLGDGQVLEKNGERGRNRTFNLLIKSKVSRLGCIGTSGSYNNNLTLKCPHGPIQKRVEKVGEIERNLTAKDTKRTQINS